ncbi:MAG TPA: hypothetical protein PLM09_02050 [Casimicrobiaceae bacterium]|nr:hypothetical protein [Casimicrobiaceae bacterium]
MSHPAITDERARPTRRAMHQDNAAPHVETHWTRVLYHDLESPRLAGDAHAGDSQAANAGGGDRSAPPPSRPGKIAALLLGLRVTVFLAVAGAMHLAGNDEAVLAHPTVGPSTLPASVSTPPRDEIPPQPRFA